MKQTKIIMDMPVVVEIADREATPELFDEVFAYFNYVDEKFSVFKATSEISAINRGELSVKAQSDDMKEVLALSEDTKRRTNGYFDIRSPDGRLDPSGLVKGWAILKAARLLDSRGVKNFYVEAGGDIQTRGQNASGEPWRVGIQNPFSSPPHQSAADWCGGRKREVVKVVHLKDRGVATSGTYIRGQHIYNPKDKKAILNDVVSLTVIGPDIYEADRFATAAFAMGPAGIEFIERLDGFEGYQIDQRGMATMTSGFPKYVGV